MTRLRTRPVLNELESRLSPAVLLHSLYPDAAGPQAEGFFGTSVAVGSNYRVVGADVSISGLVKVGQAYVYNSVNALVAVLNYPSPAADYAYFGNAVAVSGNIVVVGALGDSTGAQYAGSAYVYDLSSMTPTVPIATLNNPNPEPGDFFGRSVAVSGNIVVVGADGDTLNAANQTLQSGDYAALNRYDIAAANRNRERLVQMEREMNALQNCGDEAENLKRKLDLIDRWNQRWGTPD